MADAKPTDREVQQILADAEMWKAFGAQMGWVLHSFTDDKSAYFMTGRAGGRLCDIHKHEREAIERAIAGIPPAVAEPAPKPHSYETGDPRAWPSKTGVPQ